MTAVTLACSASRERAPQISRETLEVHPVPSRWQGWARFAVSALVFGPVAAALLRRGQGRRASHALTCGRCRARLRVRRAALGCTAVVLLFAGVIRATSAVGDLPDCGLTGLTPDQRQAFATDGGVHADARAALTWMPTGAALAYADARGAALCASDSEGLIVAHMPEGFAREGTLVGQVYLTYRKESTGRDLFALGQHEGRHVDQWAAIGSVGGPFAFPLLYAIDEALFPHARNHFERMAGLEDGGYAMDDAAAGPRLPPVAVAALFAIPLLRRLRRLRSPAAADIGGRRTRSHGSEPRHGCRSPGGS